MNFHGFSNSLSLDCFLNTTIQNFGVSKIIRKEINTFIKQKSSQLINNDRKVTLLQEKYLF